MVIHLYYFVNIIIFTKSAFEMLKGVKYGHLYTIEHFNYPTDNNIVVRYYNDDSICSPSDQIKTIKIEDILGMLVYHGCYSIKK